jgi:large subunit ribosomal protein L3
MTRIFDENGDHIPVTVIKLIPNFVSQVKTIEKDGYEAYQVAYNEKASKLINKPKKEHLKKANIEMDLFRFKEVKVAGVDAEAIGSEVTLGMFEPSTYIDVTSVTKGKGFQGVMKKYNFSGGCASHGSHFHRRTGSIGNRATPGRVRPGKKMPGQMGDNVKTIQNVLVQEVNLEKGYMLLKGSIPRSKDSFVRIAKALKK